MSEDHELLRSYASSRSESAFAQLVSRHVGFVYATALRMVAGDLHLAQDVAQSVFIDLSRKASSLLHLRSLEAWLYQATRFASAKALRTEHRRSVCERAAIEMEINSSQSISADSINDWERIAPVLDEAIEQLASDDREAILLRFFARKNFRAVAESVGTTEEAARKRVSRALEKLRTYLSRSGVSISETSLVAALATGATAGAPPALATTITSAALAAPLALGGTATLLHIMSTAKTKIAIASLSLVAIPLVVQHQTASSLKEDNQKLIQQLQAAQAALESQTTRTNAPNLSSTDHLELMRLRANVTALRQENQALKEARPANAPKIEEQDAAVARGSFVPKELWTNVGFDTPERAFQSFLAVLKEADPAKIPLMVEFDVQWKETPTEDDIELVEKSKHDYFRALERAPSRLNAFRIEGTTAITPERRRILLVSEGVDGKQHRSSFELANMNGIWKPRFNMYWFDGGGGPNSSFATSPLFGPAIDFAEN